jgi:non-specific serine/threonine protein kinase/serine/threonine-protein kinase
VSADRLQDASDLAKELLERRFKKLGAEHPTVLGDMRVLQDIQLRLGEYQAAEATIRQWKNVLEIRPAVVELEIARARTALSEALLEQGERAAGLAELRQAMEYFSKQADPPSEKFRAISLIGWLNVQKKEWDKAEPQLIEAYNRLKSNLSELTVAQRWYATRACERIVEMYESWDKPDEAARWRQELQQLK